MIFRLLFQILWKIKPHIWSYLGISQPFRYFSKDPSTYFKIKQTWLNQIHLALLKSEYILQYNHSSEFLFSWTIRILNDFTLHSTSEDLHIHKIWVEKNWTIIKSILENVWLIHISVHFIKWYAFTRVSFEIPA